MPTGSSLWEAPEAILGGVQAGVGAVQHAARAAAPGVNRPKSQMSREQAAIQRASERWKINPAYLWGIFGVETSFGSKIDVSSTGARGPFQFEPATAKQYGYPLGVNEHSITNWGAFQAQANAAAHYLAAHGGVKDPQGAVRSYNPGEASYLGKVIAAAQSWGKAMTTQATNEQETTKVEENPLTPEGSTWTKFGELGLNLILVLAGAALLVYGVMVALRPRENALSLPKAPAVVPI